MKGFKDSTTQRNFSMELRKILMSDAVRDMVLPYNIYNTTYRFELTSSQARGILQYVVDTIPYDITITNLMKIDMIYYATKNITRRMGPLNFVMTYNEKNYQVNSPWWQDLSLKIKPFLTDAEKIKLRKSKETEYAIIIMHGKKALVKLIDGDRRAIAAKRYVKKELIDGKDEDAIRLLYKLNPDGLTKGE